MTGESGFLPRQARGIFLLNFKKLLNLTLEMISTNRKAGRMNFVSH